ncbi:hypothetical protein F511_37951 [Dorcoceras hygrometricum]|uniref:Uncharacterized protein n=1 Tax=Dorcoceras hygrometricum TaxID=472368 RepID=A0A2Z7CDG3_9LAMI|nr:hypothetical protein F511_37951 [Dorcoceras hygrometricum]
MMNQLKHVNQLLALKSKDEPAVAIQEARSYEESQAGAGAMKKISWSALSWMSTAEHNSNGENDKKPAKEKDASTVLLLAQRRRSAAAISVQQMVRNISISSWFDAFKESAVELAMETSRVTSAVLDRSDLIVDRSYDEATVIRMNRMATNDRLASHNPSLQAPKPPPLLSNLTHDRRASAAPPPSVRRVIGLVSITATRSFRPCQNPSDLLVQIDGGILIPVVDLIDDLPPPTARDSVFSKVFRLKQLSGFGEIPRTFAQEDFDERQKNFVPGTSFTSIDIMVMDVLDEAHKIVVLAYLGLRRMHSPNLLNLLPCLTLFLKKLSQWMVLLTTLPHQKAAQIRDLVHNLTLEQLTSQKLLTSFKSEFDQVLSLVLNTYKSSFEVNSSLATLNSQLVEVFAHLKRTGDAKKGAVEVDKGKVAAAIDTETSAANADRFAK